jgi:hypothetical protein
MRLTNAAAHGVSHTEILLTRTSFCSKLPEINSFPLNNNVILLHICCISALYLAPALPIRARQGWPRIPDDMIKPARASRQHSTIP